MAANFIQIIPEQNEDKLSVANYESVVLNAKQIVEQNKPFEIQSFEDKKVAKQKRANINKLVDTLKNVRLDTTRSITGTFEEQCKTLEKLFTDLSKEWGEEIKKYEEANEDKKPKESVVVVTCKLFESDKETLEKLEKYLSKSKINYTKEIK